MSKSVAHNRLRAIVARFALIAAGVLALGPVTTGCDFVNKPTKVAKGQLYQSGDAKYDPYFEEVHREQVASAEWVDESKAARKPIVTALNLRPGASNDTILSAVREKKGDASLGGAIDETTSAERERGKKLTAASERLDELLKRGDELKKQIVEERRNMGAEKADDKAVAKIDELKREMSAAVDAVSDMLSDAKRAAKEADELARKLRGAWTGKEDEEPDEPRKDEAPKKKPDPPPVAKKPAAKPKPAPASDKPAEPKPPPKPAQKPADEVFNP